MKKVVFTFTILLAFVLSSKAQTNLISGTDKSYIEVIGANSIDVIPDMLYISISLREKKGISVESQEDTLKNVLQRCEIPFSKLTINKAQSTYSKISFASRTGVTQKVYSLLLSDAATMARVFDEFEKTTVINNYRLEKISHSKIDSLVREVKTKAIKEAKSQAEYLLSAINEKIGKPMEIREVKSDDAELYNIVGGIPARYGNSRNYDYNASSWSSGETVIGVQNINIKKFVYIKFAIQ
jgi:hypothetical protein